MEEKEIQAKGIKVYVNEGEREIARAYLYIMKNSLHEEPFGLMEDVFVDESLRGKGYGTKLVEKVIEIARRENCYKLICTSRHTKPKVHDLYEKLGFKNHGLEFRMDI